VQYHGRELILREQTLELSGEKDSWSQPSCCERGIGQSVDNANARQRLAGSLRCSFEGAPIAWAARPKTSEHTFQLSARSNSIQSRVDQTREQQEMKAVMDGRQQRLERDHAQTQQVVAIRNDRPQARDNVMAQNRGCAEQYQ